MSCSPEVHLFVSELWDAAIADARVDPDRFHLLGVRGTAPADHLKAACYPPGIQLAEEPGDVIKGPALVEANNPAHRGKHRIAFYEDIDETDPLARAIAGGTLRHEIRHGEQREACGPALFDLDELLDQVNYAKMGGLPGGTVIYHLKPIEMDANAAAAMFLRTCFPELIANVLETDNAPLARSNTGPGELRDLPAKTVAQLFAFREVAEAAATFNNTAVPFVKRLRLVDPHAATTWDRLVDSDRPDAAA